MGALHLQSENLLITNIGLIVISFYFTLQTAFFTTRFDNEMANSGKTKVE